MMVTMSRGQGSRLTREQLAAYRRIPEQMEYVESSRFEEPGIEETLFGPGSEVTVPRWVSYEALTDEAAPSPVARAGLTGRDEAILFLRYNYARRRVAQLAAAQKRRHSDARAAEMVAWYERAQQARADLAEANMALVPAMARRWQIPSVDFAELVSEGNMALLRTVDKFDVSRGFKFSTYACRAILAAFQRLSINAGRYHRRFNFEFDPQWDADCSVGAEAAPRDANALHALQRVLAGNLAQLSDLEKRILLERFPMTGQAPRRTLREISSRVGMSNERVRQLQNAALAKVRYAMESVL